MKKYNRRISGFTIIELLVVIVIIGILAAITFVSYGGIQAKVKDVSVLSDLETMDALQTSYGLSHNTVGKAYYSGSGADVDLEFTPSEGNVIDVVVNEVDYCIRGYNPSSSRKSINDTFIKESSDGACSRIPPSVAATGLSSPIVVSGGLEAIDGSYTVRTFTSDGTLSVTGGTLAGVDVLIVGGGDEGKRGGSPSWDYGGYGGRGGQAVLLTNQNLAGDITIVIGYSKQNSSFGSTIAIAGTGGAAGIPSTGNGGAGSNGYSSGISGSSKYYGSGGGAGGGSTYGSGGLGGADGGAPGAGAYAQTGFSGTPNTGGGGGGGMGGAVLTNGGAGGSGVVIIRYLTP